MNDEKSSGKFALVKNLPSKWHYCRLKNYATIKNGQDYKNVSDTEGKYPVIGSGGPFAFSRTFLYDKESVLLGRKGTIDKPLYINYPFWTVDTMYYTEIKEFKSVKYFYYLCTSLPFDFYQYGTALPSMTQQTLNDVLLPLPPFKVQQKIAEELDKKCARIDRLIALQEEMIAELQAYKQAIITEAVTKGLNSSVLKKDSRLDWIDSYPATWTVLKLKNVCEMNSGKTLTAQEISDEGEFPVYGGNGVRGFYSESNSEGECVIIGRQGALCGNVKHIVHKIWATDHAIVTSPREIVDVKYLYYLVSPE